MASRRRDGRRTRAHRARRGTRAEIDTSNANVTVGALVAFPLQTAGAPAEPPGGGRPRRARGGQTMKLMMSSACVALLVSACGTSDPLEVAVLGVHAQEE